MAASTPSDDPEDHRVDVAVPAEAAADAADDLLRGLRVRCAGAEGGESGPGAEAARSAAARCAVERWMAAAAGSYVHGDGATTPAPATDPGLPLISPLGRLGVHRCSDRTPGIPFPGDQGHIRGPTLMPRGPCRVTIEACQPPRPAPPRRPPPGLSAGGAVAAQAVPHRRGPVARRRGARARRAPRAARGLGAAGLPRPASSPKASARCSTRSFWFVVPLGFGGTATETAFGLRGRPGRPAHGLRKPDKGQIVALIALV